MNRAKCAQTKSSIYPPKKVKKENNNNDEENLSLFFAETDKDNLRSKRN